MEIQDLEHDERLALVALVIRLVEADGRATDDETSTIGGLVRALGRPTWRALAEEADERFTDEESLRTFLRGIERQEARELILGTAITAATADAIAKPESELLTWLRRTWNVPVRIEPPPTT